VCLDARGRSNFKSLLFRREWPYFYTHSDHAGSLAAAAAEAHRSSVFTEPEYWRLPASCSAH
jgi:hypothetical protein